MSIQMITGSAAAYVFSQEPAVTTFNYTSKPAKNSRSLSVGSAYSSAPSSREQSPRPSFSATFEEETQQGAVAGSGHVSSRGTRYHVYGRGRSPLPLHSMTAEYPENGATVVDDRGRVLMVRTASNEQRASSLASEIEPEFTRSSAAVYVKETRGRERQREREYRC